MLVEILNKYLWESPGANDLVALFEIVLRFLGLLSCHA